MTKNREIKTCSRCRRLKLRCDRTKPSCQRCSEAEVSCSPTTSGAEPSLESPALPRRQAKVDKKAVKEDGIAKTRQRAHLSCGRCHRLKVKCDRDLPCGRCRGTGWGRHCSYNHQVADDKQHTQTRSEGEEAQPGSLVSSSWHAQRRGPTHWKQVLSTVSINTV